ncbi:unnamed protein product [Sphenostylis stenocarpa]|uniref:Uncharacterized protein n=1 Tax=Sphenostylis stenocarpa TaxID=92480 RepID=A0AA86VBR2_9FABA|nr:unnamed protein product [Sphenostylis stenocarpa]
MRYLLQLKEASHKEGELLDPDPKTLLSPLSGLFYQLIMGVTFITSKEARGAERSFTDSDSNLRLHWQVAPNRAREDRDFSQHLKTKRRGCRSQGNERDGAVTNPKGEKRIRVNPLARVRVDEVKEFRLGQFRPVEANERENRSTTRAEAEYKIALLFYDSTVKEAHFTISLGMGRIK